MNHSHFGALCLVAATLGMASCGDAGDPAETDAAWSDPEAPAGITVSEGRLMLPAVGGNPGAVYFSVRNSGDEDQVIRSVWVAGTGSAMLHETRMEDGAARMREASEVPVPAGEAVAFAPGGLHVMATEVGETLEEGGQTEVTLTFASGDKVSFPVEVRAAGDSGSHAGMEH